MSTLIRRFGDDVMRHASRVNALAFAPDGASLASIGGDDRVRAWSSATGRRTLDLPRGGFFGDGVGFAGGRIVFTMSEGVLAVALSGDRSEPVLPRAPGWFPVDLRAGGDRVAVVERYGVAYEPDAFQRVRVASRGGERTLALELDRRARARLFPGRGTRVIVYPNQLALSAGGRFLAVLALAQARVEGRNTTATRVLLSWDLDARRAGPTVAVVPEPGGEAPDDVTRAYDGATGRLAVSGDGAHVLIGYEVARLVDRALGTELHRFRFPEGSLADPAPAGVAFANGDRAVVVAASAGLGVFDARDGALLRARPFAAPRLVGGLAVSDAARAVAIAEDSTLDLFSLESLQPLRPRRGHGARIEALAVDSRGSRLASLDESSLLQVWHAASGEVAWSRRGAQTGPLSFSPDAERLLAAGPVLFDAAQGDLLGAPGTHFGVCGFTPAGEVCCLEAGESGTLRVASGPEASDPVEIAVELPPGESPSLSPALSADASTALLSRLGGAFAFWNVASRRKVSAFRRDGLASAALSPDGALAAVFETFSDGIDIVSRETGEVVRRLPVDAGLSATAMHWIAGGTLAVSRDEGRIALYRSGAGAGDDPPPGVEFLVGGHEGPVWSMASSPDGRFLASGGSDGTVALWRIA